MLLITHSNRVQPKLVRKKLIWVLFRRVYCSRKQAQLMQPKAEVIRWNSYYHCSHDVRHISSFPSITGASLRMSSYLVCGIFRLCERLLPNRATQRKLGHKNQRQMISLNALFCSIICDGMVQSVFVESLMHQSPIMTQKKKIEYLRNVGGTLKVFIEKKRNM